MARSPAQLNDKEMKYFEGVKPWGCTAGHPAGTTVRFTTDNRLYVRNGFSYATHLTTSHQRIRRAVPKLRRAFENRFPEIKHVNFEFIYGGMINMTMNFRPLMTQKHPSVYASASGEGAGVAQDLPDGSLHRRMDQRHRQRGTPFPAPHRHSLPHPAGTPDHHRRHRRLMWEEFNAKSEI